jgi:hypothetical protein
MKSGWCITASIRHIAWARYFPVRCSGVFFFWEGATSALFVGVHFIANTIKGRDSFLHRLSPSRFTSDALLITLCLGSLSTLPRLPLSLEDLVDCPSPTAAYHLDRLAS